MFKAPDVEYFVENIRIPNGQPRLQVIDVLKDAFGE